MVPELPTATCDGLAVVLVLDVSLFLAQENIVKLKIKINIMYIFFIFISFLIYILNIQSNSNCRFNPLYLRTVDLCLPNVNILYSFLNYKLRLNGNNNHFYERKTKLWRESDCEELVGAYRQK